MNKYSSPETIIQRQLDAYNAHDLDALLATYALEAKQFEHPGKLLANGHAQIRERMTARFQDSQLHARLIKRSVMGNVVIDQEEVTRTFPEGRGVIELVAIYEVQDGKIQTSSVIFGTTKLYTK
ncbi:MAG: nuclear transport factor 2 family protein [Burkholderiales bacterium]